MDQVNFKGNERQLKLLLRAVREKNVLIWNNFVKESGKLFTPNLEGVNLSDLDLKEINLTRANLINANLEGANLSRANLSLARLNSINLKNALLKGTKFTGADMTWAKLSKAQCSFSDFRDANLTDADFTEADLSMADMTKTNMKRTTVLKANMNGVKRSPKVKIVARAEMKNLTEEELKKLSPWKIAKQEEQARKRDRIQKLEDLAQKEKEYLRQSALRIQRERRREAKEAKESGQN